MEQPKNDVLKVKRLHVEFQTSHGMVHAVKDVSLEVKRGRIHALVGESGSGKSVTSLTIMNLLAGNGKVISGDVTLNEKSLLKLSGKEKRQLYGDRIGMIFQDPTAALDPLFTVEQLLLEGLRKHRRMSKKQAREAALESLRMMNLRDPEELMKKKPYELSGGMCQRVMIAIAMSMKPDYLIADEPTTALDVTIQAQILDLMRDLQKKIKTSIIIITHNLGVVANIADRVAVMYGGKLVETGDVEDIFHNPCHEYTKGLLRSIPKAHEKGGELQAIPGTPPDLMEPPVGCPFAARCKETMIVCQKYMPDYTDCGKNHKSACWMLDEMAQEVNSDEKSVSYTHLTLPTT